MAALKGQTSGVSGLVIGAGSAPLRATIKSRYGAGWAKRVLGIP
jgi:hypothetical protein